MRKLVDLEKLDRLDNLIRRQATGNPNDLAYRLGIAPRNLYKLIAFLRDDMQAPIRYSKPLISYVYDYTPRFYLGFEKERLPINHSRNLSGGMAVDELLPKSR